MKQKKLYAGIILVAVLILLVSALARSQPIAAEGVDLVSSERKPTSTTGFGVQAQAGNVTQLQINATRITNHWQGYYGNISGEITLDDADSNTLFSWSLASAQGEIFAVNTSDAVQWSNVTCVNFTNTTGSHGATKINGTTLDNQFGIAASEVDGFNDTFDSTFTGTIDVGDVIIDSASACPQTYLFVNNQSQTTDYQEILLFDNLSALVFAAIIEPSGTQGFDGSPWDFQMLTAQNDSVIGTYYFYVELS